MQHVTGQILLWNKFISQSRHQYVNSIMMERILNYLKRNYKAILLLILVLNFTIRLIIYFTATLFYFSDFRAYFDAIESIKSGNKVPLYIGEFSYLNSYLAYFFKYIIGNIDYYFIVNSLFGTIATYVVYRIMIALNLSREKGIIAALILSIYTEFMVFGSVLYTPIIMATILGLVILFSIRFIRKEHFSLKYFLLIIALISVSLLLKRELIYTWALYLAFAVIQILSKNRKLGRRFIILSVVLFLSTFTISQKVILKDNDYLKNRSFLIFEGHTWYGGDGGKAQITYPEKQELFDRKFKDYCLKRGIQTPDSKDILDFKNLEVKEFVAKHPFSWIRLQGHKFFWEYGILPESTSFRILMTGLLNGKTILAALVLVVPVVVIITSLIMTLDLKGSIKKVKKEPTCQLMTILLVYYIIATVFYYSYSERYRIPVMVCFWIPLLAHSISEFRLRLLLKNKKELIIKTLVFLVFAVNWSYEAYVIGIKNRVRYDKTIYEIQEINNDHGTVAQDVYKSVHKSYIF